MATLIRTIVAGAKMENSTTEVSFDADGHGPKIRLDIHAAGALNPEYQRIAMTKAEAAGLIAQLSQAIYTIERRDEGLLEQAARHKAMDDEYNRMRENGATAAEALAAAKRLNVDRIGMPPFSSRGRE